MANVKQTTMRRKVIQEKTDANKASAPLNDIARQSELQVLTLEEMNSQRGVEHQEKIQSIKDVQDTINVSTDVIEDSISSASDSSNQIQNEQLAAQELALEQREIGNSYLKKISEQSSETETAVTETENEFKPLQGVAPPVKFIPPPLVVMPDIPEKKEPPLPANEDNKEKGQSTILAKMAEDIKGMSKGLNSVAGSVSRILFQMTLDAVKMIALLTAGILAFDAFAVIAQVIWAKYGEQIKEAFTWIKEAFGAIVEEIGNVITSIWNNSIFQTMIENIAFMFQDLKDGTFVEGWMRQVQEGFKMINFMLRDAFAAIINAIPGMGDTADNMKANIAQEKLNAGFAISTDEKALLTKKREAGVSDSAIEERLIREYETNPNSGLEKSIWTGNLVENEAYKKRFAEEKEKMTSAQGASPEVQSKLMDIEAAQGKLNRATEYANQGSRSEGTKMMIQNAEQELNEAITNLNNPELIKNYFGDAITETMDKSKKAQTLINENQLTEQKRKEANRTVRPDIKQTVPDRGTIPLVQPRQEVIQEQPVTVANAVQNNVNNQSVILPARTTNASSIW